MKVEDLQSHVRCRMMEAGVSISELARRTGRRREDVRRSLSRPHEWRLDRIRDYAMALGMASGTLMRDKDPSWQRKLARHARWDDRLSTRADRERRLSGPDRFREIARILEGVPMDDYWRDLDIAGLYGIYPRVRPHLRRTRGMWDIILPVLLQDMK